MNQLCLITGGDLPFPEGKLMIHQPTLKEIGMLGEDEFFLGCGFLSFSKNILNSSDKKGLDKIDDFNIIMSIITGKIQSGEELKNSVDAAFNVLYLMFPKEEIKVEDDKILIGEGCLDKTNFDKFKKILKEMYNLTFKDEKVQKDYKPANSAAAAIAEKLKKRHNDLVERSGGVNDGKINLFSRYLSIVSIYLGLSMKELEQYTVFQLYDSFNRVQLKLAYDMAIRAKLAGAKDVKDPDDWMKDLYKK